MASQSYYICSSLFLLGAGGDEDRVWGVLTLTYSSQLQRTAGNTMS